MGRPPMRGIVMAATARRKLAEQRQRGLAAGGQLIHGALARVLVRAPAHESGTMTKTAAGEVVVFDLHYQLRRQRLPLRAPFGAPAAGPTRGGAREAWRLDQFLEAPGKAGAHLAAAPRL